MRFSTLLGKTLRQPPAEAHLPSHQLLVRAGCVRGLETGLFAYLPLGRRLLRRLQALIRRELSALGGQELALPAMPEAGPGETMVRLVDREIDSYRQLPALLFRFTDLTVPQPGARSGLFGATERPSVEILFSELWSLACPPAESTLTRVVW